MCWRKFYCLTVFECEREAWLKEKISFRLSEETLAEVEQRVEDGEFASRSEALRACVDAFLAGHSEADLPRRTAFNGRHSFSQTGTSD